MSSLAPSPPPPPPSPPLSRRLPRRRLLFGTLGMFIIDTFQYIDAFTGADQGDGGRGERIGGGGTYATVGARAWLRPEELLMVVDRGVDFKPEWQGVLDAYARGDDAGHSGDLPLPASRHRMWKYRDRTVDDTTGTDEEGSDKTTKALNIYRGEMREFHYLTPRLRLNPSDLQLPGDGDPMLPRWIHCVCSPLRLVEIANALRAAAPRPRICWEPLDMTATAENLQDTLRAMADVDVFSPNHSEAASFLSISSGDNDGDSSGDALDLDRAAEVRTGHLDSLAREFHRRFRRHHATSSDISASPPLIVIRCGAAGSVALSPDGTITASVPSYHLAAGRTERVVDVTGGGNAFLGGFVAYLAAQCGGGNDGGDDGDRGGRVDGDDGDVGNLPSSSSLPPSSSSLPSSSPLSSPALHSALAHGSVSASYAIEQLGLPSISSEQHDGVAEETWNGEAPRERLKVYGIGG